MRLRMSIFFYIFAADFKFRIKMQKIAIFLLSVLAVVNVMAEEAEDPIIITIPDTTIVKQAFTLEVQGITISTTNGSVYPAEHEYNNFGRDCIICYANASITFSAGQDIKGLAINGNVKKNFSASCDQGTMDYLSDSYEDAEGEPVLTISDIDAPSVTITCNNQLRCFSIEVYFTENPDGSEGVENVEEPKAQSQKMLRDGQLIIRRGEKTFTVTGQECGR